MAHWCHRSLSTGAMEEVIANHPAVAECAVIGISDPLKGQVPLGLVVTQTGANPNTVAPELVGMVRESIGPVAFFKHVIVVPCLPKTRSGEQHMSNACRSRMRASVDNCLLLVCVCLCVRTGVSV